jgi:hypothetical protein
VGHDHGRRRRFVGRAEDFADAHDAGVQAALIDSRSTQHAIAGVQQDDPQFFLKKRLLVPLPPFIFSGR